MNTGYRLQFGNLGWRAKVGAVIATAVGLAAAIALIILSLTLAVILIPVVAVIFLVARWRFRKVFNEARKQTERSRDDGRTIEIDYTVIDDDRPTSR